MKAHDFIFSKKPSQRYYRHIAFWLLRYLFIFQAISCSMYFFYILNKPESIKIAAALALYSVVAEITFSYIIAYWLIPKFFKSNKTFFFTAILILSGLLVWAQSPVYRQWFQFQDLRPYSFELVWEYVMITTTISHGICAVFITCQLFKNYYLKLEERETLTRENTNAEMQLLKAQVHPHFLFNTLNNIYSFAIQRSTDTGNLVLKLSDTLKYMLNECDVPFVAVAKEIKMIYDYIGLEKVRYGSRLDLKIEMKGEYKNKLIVPLLLIPFIENCFKHGASKMLKHPWIKLSIIIKENDLFMEVSNNKPSAAVAPNSKSGIGLKNVQKRLQLLYPEQHELVIKETEDEFSVKLKLPLEIVNENNRREAKKPVHEFALNSFYA